MLLADNRWQWLQMLIFMLSSLGLLIFECFARPFDTPQQNRMELFNEINVLLVCYLSVQILYSSWSPEMGALIGVFLNWVILGGVCLNVGVIVLGMLKELCTKCMRSIYIKIVKRR